MAESVFADRSRKPSLAELYQVLGVTEPLLQELESRLAESLGELTHEWKFYGKRAGWTLAIDRGGRRILHLIPRAGRFTVVFTLGKRAQAACRHSDLPSEILADLEAARDYAEGRSIRFDITSSAGVRMATQLAALKMAN